jgi:DNA (cytosine-5)-methyltransferase 1
MTHADEVMRFVGHDIVQNLNARMGTGGNQVPIIFGDENETSQCGLSVRKLTVTECERLQGLPDGWTDVEINGKPAPDSKRYKAIGNGMAVPCSTFIMRRIAEVASGQNKGHD